MPDSDTALAECVSGFHCLNRDWIPACAGMTISRDPWQKIYPSKPYAPPLCKLTAVRYLVVLAES